MDNIQQKHIYSSTEVIEDILSKLGIVRETNSTYVEHLLPNGEYLRLRISNHGIYLQRWFDKNKERRMNGENIPKLNIGSNLAITFAPNEQECIAQGETFPMKVRNDTSAKTKFGNNVKPQFTITHICYNTWELSKQDVELIGNTIQTYVTVGGEFTEPIQDDNKVSIWIDQSNSYPNRLQGKEYSKTNNANQTQNNKTDKNESKNMNRKNIIRLTESELKQIITESVKKILKEDSLNPYGNGYGFNNFQVEGVARDRFFKLKGFDSYNEAKSIANDPNDDRLTLEQFERLVDEWLKIAQKHNERSDNNYTSHITTDGKFKVIPDYSREAEEKRFKDYTKDEYERRARKKRIGTWREKDGDRWEERYDKPQKQPWR